MIYMKKFSILLLSLTLIFIFSGCLQTPVSTDPNTTNVTILPGYETVPLDAINNTTLQINSSIYDPPLNPNDFVVGINNKFLTFIPRTKFVYQANTQDGLEHIEVYVTTQRKNITGIETIVVWDRVWLNNDLVEETYDFYAQDKQGNIWYFGEETKELMNGSVISTSGSWEAGVNGAKPGIVMKANPSINDSYRQEYYAGEAEDMANIIALNVSVSVSFGNFTDCLKSFDYTPLDPSLRENKYYCTETKNVVLETDLKSNERVELVSIEYNTEPSSSIKENLPVLKNLGITIDSWNRQTNMAGDFLFENKNYVDNKIFTEFGHKISNDNGEKLLPEIGFNVPVGTMVVSPIDGVITDVNFYEPSQDYLISMKTDNSSPWIVGFEHVYNVRINVGDTVLVGQELAEVSPSYGRTEFGNVEIDVWTGGPSIIKYCPFEFLDESLKPTYEEKLNQLANDWEEFSGKDVYKQEDWIAPGCLLHNITEK